MSGPWAVSEVTGRPPDDVHGGTFQDAATTAYFRYQNDWPLKTLAQLMPDLREMIRRRTWRSPDAAQVLLLIQKKIIDQASIEIERREKHFSP